MPVELAGLIPAEEFTSRIRGINMRLAKYRGHEDYGPIIRGVMIVAYLGVCIVLLCFVNQLPALVLWTAMFAGLFAVSAALLHFIKQKPVSLGENFDFIGDGYLIQFVRFVEDEVARFNQLDASRGVRWKSLREHNPALFALRYNRETAQVPWRIAVFYLASDQPMEFLPAYEASHLSPVEPRVSESLSIDLNLLGKAPSYNADTTVPMIQLTEVPPTQIEEIMPSQAPAYASQSSLEGRDE
ncbi:hypothetical protein HDU82_005701 [Entophlyctis luteolus]|nr:hypothetical protein HDU82_005701 [Entophlyctis luteolus]